MTRFKKRDTRTAWLFITPYLIGYLMFHFAPIFLSFLMSLTNIRYISRLDNMKIVGIANYIEMFKDPEFINALSNSIKFTIMYVPLVMVFGLLMAVLINKPLYARNPIRGMLFMPYVSNMVAIAVVWSILLDPVSGVINMFLRSIGIHNPPMWLMGTKTALVSVVIIAVWQGVGLNFITYLAALQNVPTEQKEAARIDGANSWQTFWSVTIPSIAPATFLLLITSVINSLKNFTVVQVLTEGGPGTSTTILPLNIVHTAFSSYRMGYACAQTIVMFLIVMGITIIQWTGKKRFED